jgi:hypothetical protein
MPPQSIFLPSSYNVHDEILAAQYKVNVAGGGELGAKGFGYEITKPFASFLDLSATNKIIRVSAYPTFVFTLVYVWGVNVLGINWLKDLAKGCSTDDIIITHTSSPCSGSSVIQKKIFKNPTLIKMVGNMGTGEGAAQIFFGYLQFVAFDMEMENV